MSTSINIFNKNYKAVSNLYVRDIEENDLVYPAPIGMCVKIKEDDKDVNKLYLYVTSYLDSPLTLDYYIHLFFYVLGEDFTLNTFLFKQIVLQETTPEVQGHKGTYSFEPNQVVSNVSYLDNEVIHKLYQKHEKTLD